MKISATVFWLPVLLAFYTPLLVTGQEDELELIDRVTELQRQLDDQKPAERVDAEQKLIAMGPRILDFLEPATDESTTDYRERLRRIRVALEKIDVNSVTEASRIKASGSMTVGELLGRFKRQTGNDIAVADDSLLDAAIDVAMDQLEFWPALEQLMSRAHLGIDRYGNRHPNQMMLAPVPPVEKKSMVPTSTAKIFRAQVTRVDASVNLLNPILDYTTVSLLIQWEPRLRPISVDMPLSKVKVTDEYGDELKLANPEEVVYGMVQPEIPEVEFSLRLPRVDRQVENVASIRATIAAVLPGRSEQFRFQKVGSLKDGFKIVKAGATVTFDSLRKNEDLFGIKLSLSFDQDHNALESHQGWVFQNEVYLQDGQGKREDAISLESFQQDNERVTIQYYFLNDPGDRTLVYKTPATIVKLPVEIELTKIPLP